MKLIHCLLLIGGLTAPTFAFTADSNLMMNYTVKYTSEQHFNGVTLGYAHKINKAILVGGSLETYLTKRHDERQEEVINNNRYQWNKTEERKINSFSLFAVAVLPVESKTLIYGKLGVTYYRTRLTIKETRTTPLDYYNTNRYSPNSDTKGLLFGVGGQYNIGDGISLDLNITASLNTETKSLPNSIDIGFGGVYSF